ncbi:hypothetical protein POJ06DRAFT_244190 [Lipomyces tetrasporus]|uniref:U1 small nuclear ribonucleoprotein component SNU71 n=1 Tax=Lipomyces tetrasporus TaxID=54092 RepID=A0AAD7QZE4_9ASCO|nr:uncharacterized protein POJ06DRAFT_244190 [Lipomyces tetrasporus]KAJ8104307.1 hypothetical protein POJ06DRAFT_244190 [Lipomyces tetrasporus]
MFEETNGPSLKSWLIHRLENISDADSEILSDYVLALLRHDQPAEEVKRMCLEQLEDFLHEHTGQFVDDVFAALASKSYMPATKAPTPAPAAQVAQSPIDQPALQAQTNQQHLPFSTAYLNRPRQQGFVPTTPGGVGPAPSLSNFIPQANAFQQQISGAPGQIGQQQGRGYQAWQQNAAGAQGTVQKKKGRCRSYDEKGYCMKGDMCPFEHGQERIIVSGTQPLDQRRGNQKTQRGGRRRPENVQFVSGPSTDPNNLALVVEKIPDENFSLDQVRSVFEAFGPVQDVSLDAEHHSAVVSFFTHDDAVKAWKSPAPVFQNRFVKVFWRRTDAEAATRTLGNHTISRKRSASPEQKIDVAEITQRQAEKQREYEQRLAKKREHEERMAEIKRKSEELRKKQEQEREALLTKIRQKEESERASRALSVVSSESGMDVDSVSVPGSSTTEALKSKLEQLKAEAAKLGVSVPEPGSTGSGYYSPGDRGRGSFRSRGRGSYRGTYSPRGRGGLPVMNTARSNLDLRTKKVSVHGLRDSAMEGFAGYLLGVGEFENIEPHPTEDDTKIVTFKDRATAEKFFFAGPEIAEVGNVKYSWYNPPAPAPGLVASSKNADTEMDDDEEEEFRRNNQATWGNGNSDEARVAHHIIDMADDDDGDVY